MNLRTVSTFRVHCQVDGERPDVAMFTTSREASRHVAELIRDLKRDGFRRAPCAKNEYDNRFQKDGAFARIWTTEGREFAQTVYSDEIAEMVGGA